MWGEQPRGKHSRAVVSSTAGCAHGSGSPERVTADYFPCHLTRWRRCWLQIDWVVYAIVLSVAFSTVFGFYRVPSASMSPTLEVGDTYIGEKISGWAGHVERGDITVFRDEMGWMDGSPTEGGLIVKRVVGLPGDHVQVTLTGVYVNGERLREDYLPDDVDPADPGVYVDVEVPEGRLFVLGDNRGDSADSRFHMDAVDGTIPVDSVVAVLKAQALPLRSAHLLSD